MIHGPSNNGDSEQQSQDFAAFRREIRYDAKVKALGSFADEFVVDVYADGLSKQPSHLGVKAYSTYSGETHAVNDEIKISFYSSGFARIIESPDPVVRAIILRGTTTSNGGKYLGYLQQLKNVDIPTTGNLSLSSFLEDVPDSDQVLMLNPIENGASSNSLVLPNYFVAMKLKTNLAGMDVYFLIGALTFAC